MAKKPKVVTFQYCEEVLGPDVFDWWPYRGERIEHPAMCDGCAVIHEAGTVWKIDLRPVTK